MAEDITESDSIPSIIEKLTGLKEPHFGRSFIHHADWKSLTLAPLFYEQPIVDFCGGCASPAKSDTLRWMAERGMLIPTFQLHPRLYDASILALMTTVPHISGPILGQLRRAIGDRSDSPFLCQNCVRKKFPGIDLLQGDAAKAAKAAFDRVWRLPGYGLDGPANAFRIAVANSDTVAIQAAYKTLDTAVALANSEALRATPQIEVPNGLGVSIANLEAFAAASLQIACPAGVPPVEYLELIHDRRGALSFMVGDSSRASINRALAITENLNREITEIREGAYPTVRKVATAVWHSTRRRLLEAVVSGSAGYAVAGVAGAAICGVGAPALDVLAEAAAERVIESPRHRRAVDSIEARIAGTSTEAFQVWRLQEAVGDRAKK